MHTDANEDDLEFEVRDLDLVASDGTPDDEEEDGYDDDDDDDGSQVMTDFTGPIERMHDIERKIGVRIEALSARCNQSGDLSVMGEIHFASAPDEDNSIEVHVLAYDDRGRVVGKNYGYVGSEGINFDAFDVSISDLPPSIHKIRVYAKSS